MNLEQFDSVVGGDASGSLAATETCTLCDESLHAWQPRYKSCRQHLECGQNWARAQKACTKTDASGASAKEAFSAFHSKGSLGSQVALEDAGQSEYREVRKKIAKNYGSPGCQAKDVRTLVVSVHRKLQVKSTATKTLVDKDGFKAFYRYVKGKSKRKIKKEWQKIKARPECYPTVKVGRKLKVWVTHDKAIAVENIIGSDTSEHRGAWNCDGITADNMLFGSHGGVQVSGMSALGGPGGPSTQSSSGMVAKDFFSSSGSDSSSDDASHSKSKKGKKSTSSGSSDVSSSSSKQRTGRKRKAGEMLNAGKTKPTPSVAPSVAPSLRFASTWGSRAGFDPSLQADLSAEIYPEDSASQVGVQKKVQPTASPGKAEKSAPADARADVSPYAKNVRTTERIANPASQASTGGKNDQEGQQDHERLEEDGAVAQKKPKGKPKREPVLDLVIDTDTVCEDVLDLSDLQKKFDTYCQDKIDSFKVDENTFWGMRLQAHLDEALALNVDVERFNIPEIVRACDEACQLVMQWKQDISNWTLPCSIKEKHGAIDGLFRKLNECVDKAKTYIGRLENWCGDAKNQRNAKKKNWRNLRGSVATSLAGRGVPLALARVVGFAQIHAKDPCQDSFIESIFDETEMCAIPLKPSEPTGNPFTIPCRFGGQLAEDVKKTLTSDQTAVRQKIEEIAAYIVTNDINHATSATMATSKMKYNTQNGWLKFHNDDAYTKHIISVMEIGKFDIQPSVAMFSGFAQTITCVQGLMSVCVLTPKDCKKLGSDLPAAVAKMHCAKLECEGEEKMGKNFLLQENDTIFVPFGGIALMVGVCQKTEENRFKKKVLVWPPQGSKRGTSDFAAVVIDPILDFAVLEGMEDLSQIAARLVLQKPSLVPSFTEMEAYQSFVALIEEKAKQALKEQKPQA